MAPPTRSHTTRLAANYGQLGASFVVGLVLVRLLLGLGEEVYATIAVLAAGVGLARLFRDALQTGLVAVLGPAWHRPDATAAATDRRAFEKSFLAAFPVVLMAAALGGLVFLLLNQLLSILNVPAELRDAASFLICCRAAQTTMATLTTPWLTMILVREKMVRHNALILSERLIELTAALLTVYWIGNDDPARSIRSFAAITCAASISLYLLTAVAMLIREPRFRPTLRFPEWSDIRTVTSSFGWNATHTLAMNFHLRLNVILVSSFFGIISGMLFSIAGQATSYLRQLTMGLVGGVDALAARHRGKDQSQQLRDLARRQMRLQGLIVFPAAGALIIAAEPLLTLWLGSRLQDPQTSLPEIALLCRLLVAGVVARSLSESWIAILTGTNNARQFAPQVLTGAILNPLVIMLAIQLLPEGIDRLVPALSFSAILMIVHLGWIPRVTAKVLGVSIADLYRPCLIAGTATIAAVLVTFGIHQFDVSTATELIAFLICYAISQLGIPCLVEPMMTSLQTSPTSSVGAFKNRPAAALLCVFLGGSLVASVATFADENWVFLATGLWAMTLMLLPVALQRHYDLFSIWSFVMLTVGVGLTLRGACLSFGFPSPERLDHLFLRGQPAAFFVVPAACLLLGLAMLTAGYCTGLLRKGSRARRFADVQYSPRRLFALSLIVLMISAVASLVYIQRTGGFSADLLSAKRTPIPGANLAGSGYQGHGGLRFAGSLAMFAHLLVLAEIFSKSSRRRKRLPLVSLAALLLLVACVVPFYASLRTTVAMNLCMSAAMIYYSTKPVRVGVMATTVVTVLLVIYLMTALRPGSGFPNQAEHGNAISSTIAVRAFEAAVINRNQIELAKTAHILHATPDTLPLKYGATISQWALAPIPRSLWPDKPIIPPGPEIGREVYHQPIAGVPPSLVAEFWWNFHLPGVVVGSFAFGVFLGFLQRRFGSSDDLLRMTIFVAGPMTLGFEAVGSSIGSGIFRGILGTAVMVILVGAVRSAKAHHAPRSRPADESVQQAS